MICRVDDTGWCERHDCKHVGRLLELALDSSELGEKYRLLWDSQMAPRYSPGANVEHKMRQVEAKKPCNCGQKSKQ